MSSGRHLNRRHRKGRKGNSQSYYAISQQFDRVPKWKRRELQKERAHKKKREKLLNSMRADVQAFDEDTFANLFDDKKNTNNNNSWNFWQTNNENSNQKKKRKSKKQRAKQKLNGFFGSWNDSDDDNTNKIRNPPQKKKRRLNEDENEDDMISNGASFSIKTIHSSNKSTEEMKKEKEKEKEIQDLLKKEIISRIHRFGIHQLRISNISQQMNDQYLNDMIYESCSIKCLDIHLFHNILHKKRLGHAILTFIKPYDCATVCQHLFNKKIFKHRLQIKPIAPQPNENTNGLKKKKSCVILMSNLHWKTSKEDIIKFFMDYKLNANNIHLHLTADGYTNGNANVEFQKLKLSEKAIMVEGKILSRMVKLSYAGSKIIHQSTADGSEYKNKTTQVAIFNISQDIMDENDIKELIIDKVSEARKESVNNDDSSLPSNIIPIDIHLIHHLQLFTTGYAHVKFGSCLKANIIVQMLNGIKFHDRILRVVWGKPSVVNPLRIELKNYTKILTFTNVKYTASVLDIGRFIRLHSENMGYILKKEAKELAIIEEKRKKKRRKRKKKTVVVDEGKVDSVDDVVVDESVDDSFIVAKKIEIIENFRGFRYGLVKVFLESYADTNFIVKHMSGKLLNGRTVNINYWQESGKYHSAKRMRNKPNVSLRNKKRRKRNKGRKKNVNKKQVNKKKENSIKVPDALLKQFGFV